MKRSKGRAVIITGSLWLAAVLSVGLLGCGGQGDAEAPAPWASEDEPTPVSDDAPASERAAEAVVELAWWGQATPGDGRAARPDARLSACVNVEVDAALAEGVLSLLAADPAVRAAVSLPPVSGDASEAVQVLREQVVAVQRVGETQRLRLTAKAATAGDARIILERWVDCYLADVASRVAGERAAERAELQEAFESLAAQHNGLEDEHRLRQINYPRLETEQELEALLALALRNDTQRARIEQLRQVLRAYDNVPGELASLRRQRDAARRRLDAFLAACRADGVYDARLHTPPTAVDP